MIYSAQRFSSDTGVSEKLAARILKLLYEHELSAEDMNSLLWRLRDWFIKNQLPTLMEKLKDEDIESVINQLISERAKWAADCPKEVCYAETEVDLAEAFNDESLKTFERAWFFSHIESDKEEFAAGDVVTIQIFRTGTWKHQEYGDVIIDKKVIRDVVKNFSKNERGIKLCVDENHEPDHKALGWYKSVYSSTDGEACFAKIELTAKGAQLLNEGAYKYFSPEIVFYKINEETGKPQRNLLIGGAFTNRPFFKGMQPLMASEGVAAGEQSGHSSTIESNVLFFSHSPAMKKFLELMAKLVDQKTISASEKAELEQAYNEIDEKDRSDAINSSFAEVVAKFDGEDAPEAEKPNEDKGDEDKGDEDTETDDTEEEEDGEQPSVPEGVEGVKANEDGSGYTITDPVKFAESVKGIQSAASNLQREATLQACEKSLSQLVFSEKRKDRVVLPKHKKKIVEFAAGLSEKQRTSFFSILGELKAVPAGTKGHNHDATPDVEKPESYSESDEAVKYFMETLGQNLATAQKSAAAYYKSKANKR